MVNISTPLVSVVVLTYNSSLFLQETLNSIFAQDYKNIELILADDCSLDTTVQCFDSWVEGKQSRFAKVSKAILKENKGIPTNCNQGWQIARGVWVKYIAGDDILLPTCISTLVAATERFKNSQIVISNLERFSEEEERLTPAGFDAKFVLLSSKKQHQLLTSKGCVISAPTAIIKRELLEKLNGFDEEIRMVEDYPFWMKSTASGVKIYGIDEVTVRYRIHGTSVSSAKSGRYLKSLNQVFWKYQSAYLWYKPHLWYDRWMRTKIDGVKSNVLKTILKFTLVSWYRYNWR